jgi:hypothetical protein
VRSADRQQGVSRGGGRHPGVESYHAGIVRTNLYNKDLMVAARKISGARDSLEGRSLLDQGIGTQRRVNLVPTDMNGIAFSRTPARCSTSCI